MALYCYVGLNQSRRDCIDKLAGPDPAEAVRKYKLGKLPAGTGWVLVANMGPFIPGVCSGQVTIEGKLGGKESDNFMKAIK